MQPENPESHAKFYTVQVNATVPITVHYKIFADSPELALHQALKLTNSKMLSPTVIHWSKIQRAKVIVYDFGSSLIRLLKNF